MYSRKNEPAPKAQTTKKPNINVMPMMTMSEDEKFIRDWLNGDVTRYRVDSRGTSYDEMVDDIYTFEPFDSVDAGILGESPRDPYEFWKLRCAYPVVPTSCANSIGGDSGTEFKEQGIWLADCPIFA